MFFPNADNKTQREDIENQTQKMHQALSNFSVALISFPQKEFFLGKSQGEGAKTIFWSFSKLSVCTGFELTFESI